MLRANFNLAQRVNSKIERLEFIKESISGTTFYLRYAENGDLIISKKLLIDGEEAPFEDLPFITTRLATFMTGLQTGINQKITAANAEFAAIQ